MRPYAISDSEELRYARDHARMLAEEWRLANWSGRGGRTAESAPGHVRRFLTYPRRATGAAMIALGRKLVPEEARIGVAASRADGGC
jgi:hypothetical protein